MRRRSRYTDVPFERTAGIHSTPVTGRASFAAGATLLPAPVGGAR